QSSYVPVSLLGVLAGIGRADQALQYARLIHVESKKYRPAIAKVPHSARTDGYIAIARGLMLRGERPRALEVLAEAVADIKDAGETGFRTFSLWRHVPAALLDMGVEDLAIGLVQDPRCGDKWVALGHLSDLFAERGNMEKAREFAVQALNL